MGIQIDLIIPPIIVALLVVIIVRVNMFVTETSVDNRLTNDMQMFADLSQRLIQEEVKMAEQILIPPSPATPGSMLSFLRRNVTNPALNDTVRIRKDERNLQVIHSNVVTAARDTVLYPASLSDISFDLDDPGAGIEPHFLNVKIETESLPEHHASKDGETTVKAFSEHKLYLRNIHIKSSS